MITPQEPYSALAEAIDIKNISLKREDMHPYGSHKGRSIPFMIDHYYKAGDRHFVISSSGNAALAAAMHMSKIGSDAELDIFVSNNVPEHKLAKLKKLQTEKIRILIKERPIQALTQAVNEGSRSLRQSTDEIALIGYESLAEELASTKNIDKGGAVFIGTSSGTTAQALAQYFLKNKLPIQVHIVQTSSCHTIAEAFETYDGPDERSIADAIVDITAFRKEALIPLIEKTGGRGWIATNDDILAAQKIVSENAGFEISTNSALSISGIIKATEIGHEITGPVICLVCGD